jgi:kanamycin kinase/aminoglycoside 3'-phosphotransferase-2
MTAGGKPPGIFDGVHRDDGLHRPFPAGLERAIRGCALQPVTHGRSGCGVYRLLDEEGAALYLKLSRKDSHASLRPEMERLAWLRGRLPVPALHLIEEDEEREYLLMGSIDGLDASNRAHVDDLPRLIDALAEGLLILHSLPIDDCPFDHTTGAELERAYSRLKRGLVDETDFGGNWSGRSAVDLFDELVARRPSAGESVFTHGDYSLPNVIVQSGRISGFVDLGTAGIGDRYRDLALAVRSLDYNFGCGWSGRLFDAYGLDRPDVERIEFHILLDEFF